LVLAGVDFVEPVDVSFASDGPVDVFAFSAFVLSSFAAADFAAVSGMSPLAGDCFGTVFAAGLVVDGFEASLAGLLEGTERLAVSGFTAPEFFTSLGSCSMVTGFFAGLLWRVRPAFLAGFAF